MPPLWYRALFSAIGGVYYRRIHLVGREHLPLDPGPVLYVGLHRNGAVDGMIYKRLFPRATFLIAARLLTSWFRRLFFTGIPVTRHKDAVLGADRSANVAAITRSAQELIAGRELFVLPEGTSDLGPRHLPFKSGVAQILAKALSAGAHVTVVPVAIFYEAPEAFRSDVTVVLGPPVPTALSAELSEPRRVATLMARITTALEAIGVNAESGADLSRIETSAAIGIDGDPVDQGARYHTALKALERAAPPEHVAKAWGRIVGAMVQRKLSTALGVPVYSRRGALWNGCWLAMQAAGVAAALVANVGPVVGAYVAGRRLADARNTIALWRILVGAPIAFAWAVTLLVVAVLTGHPWVMALYAGVTALGLALYSELRARWPKLRNAMQGSPCRADVHTVRHWVESLLEPTTSPALAPAPISRRVGRRLTRPSLLTHV